MTMQSISLTFIRSIVFVWATASSGWLNQPAMAQDLVTKEGRHLRLITDLPDSAQLSELVAAFDAAVPQWPGHWQLNASKLDDWRVTAYLMQNKATFAAQGLIPPSLPDFRNGYQAGNRLWVVSQPSDYYTRHLLLHEGVHGVTSRLFGGSGPPWYMEGTAEYLATHRWDPSAGSGAERLQMGVIPAERESVPEWGRIDLIARGRQLGEVPTIETVMRYSDTAHRDVDPYAWSWLAVTMLEMYPQYRSLLLAAAKKGTDRSPQFTREFYQQLQDQWPVLAARWRLLSWDIDYGFDPERNQVELPAAPPANTGDTISMQLDVGRGWQAAPFKLMPGQSVAVSAQGRYTIRQTLQPWESEADGVTIEYHRGWPLGRLLACALPLQSVNARYLPELSVIAVGSAATVAADQESWLLFKVNEPAGHLADNAGTLEIRLDVNGSTN
jgi:hypothetical protein